MAKPEAPTTVEKITVEWPTAAGLRSEEVVTGTPLKLEGFLE